MGCETIPFVGPSIHESSRGLDGVVVWKPGEAPADYASGELEPLWKTRLGQGMEE